MKKNFKVGIIGCGRAGWLFNEDKLAARPVSHMSAYAANKKVEIAALCDIDPRKLRGASRKYGVKKVYSDYRKMLSDETLDIISICTPADSHAEICDAAATSGVRAIFCEKPVACSLKDAEKMIISCKKNGVKLIVNYTRSWDILFNGVRKILAGNFTGKINVVTAFSPVGLLNSGTHMFSLLREYFGDAESVAGSLFPDKSTDPGGTGIITFKNGVQCFFNSSFRDYVLFRIDIYGEKGILEIKGGIRDNEVFRVFIGKKSKAESGVKELEEARYRMDRRIPPLSNAIENIIDNLERRTPIACTGKDAKAALEIALAFHESSRRKGRKLTLPLSNKTLKVIPRETSFTKNGRLK